MGYTLKVYPSFSDYFLELQLFFSLGICANADNLKK